MKRSVIGRMLPYHLHILCHQLPDQVWNGTPFRLGTIDDCKYPAKQFSPRDEGSKQLLVKLKEHIVLPLASFGSRDVQFQLAFYFPSLSA